MKLVALYPDQPNGDAFRAHYVNKHLPLVQMIPGLLAMSYSFDVQPLDGGESILCLFEAEFADQAALEAAMVSPEGRAVSEDSESFVQIAPRIFRYCAIASDE